MQSFWILVATFSTTLTYAFMKMIETDCAFYEIFFVRSLFLMLATVLLAAGSGVSLKTAYPWLHLRRLAAGITALSLNIIVVQHLPLGSSQTLAYTAPLFVAGAAVGLALHRGSRVDPRLLTAVVLGFVGVCLVMRPQSSDGELLWAALGLFSGFCAAVVSLTLKTLGNAGEPVARTVAYFSVGSFVLSGLVVLVCGEHEVPELLSDPWLWAVGAGTVASQFAQAQGWGRGRTLLCANLQFSAVIFAVLLGAVFFGESPDAFAIAGMALIVAAECAAAYFQLVSARKR